MVCKELSVEIEAIILSGLSALGSSLGVGSMAVFFVKRELRKIDRLDEAAAACRVLNAETFATKDELRAVSNRLDAVSSSVAELRGRLQR